MNANEHIKVMSLKELISKKSDIFSEENKISKLGKHTKTMIDKNYIPSDELNTGTMSAEEINFEMKYPTKKANKVIKSCPICGGTYTYNNYNLHSRTKVHQAYQNMNEKLLKILRMTN
jgi:hypothetical protein